MSNCVGIIDSGIGGLSILKTCAEKMPNADFVYLADIKNSPYGNKSRKAILQIVNNAINYLIENYNIKVLILACNTATVTCINELRKYHNIPIIGAEPAIKKAILHKNVIILSTNATKKNSRLLKYYRRYKNIKLVSKHDWAKLIDDNIDNLDMIKDKFNIKLKNSKSAIVLGCTHYVFIKKILQDKYPQCEFFDGSDDIAKRLDSISTINDYCGKRLIKCISSQKNYQICHDLTKIFENIS